MKLDIKTNFPQVQRQIAQLRSDVAQQATVRAINRTIDLGKTEAVRSISREYNVTSAYVRERLAIRKASFRQGRFGISAELAASGRNRNSRSANLIAFIEKTVSLAAARRRMAAGEGGAYKLRNGGQVAKALELRFKIKRGQPAKTIKGAFIGNKGRTVFIREGKDRLPIKALSTVDVPSMFNARRVNDVIVNKMLARFPEVFAREAKFYTDRFNQGRK